MADKKYTTEQREEMSASIRKGHGDETFINETLYHFGDFENDLFSEVIEEFSEVAYDQCRPSPELIKKAIKVMSRLGKSHLLEIEAKLDTANPPFQDEAA